MNFHPLLYEILEIGTFTSRQRFGTMKNCQTRKKPSLKTQFQQNSKIPIRHPSQKPPIYNLTKLSITPSISSLGHTCPHHALQNGSPLTSAWLKIVTRYQARSSIRACHFRFPPAIILKPQHGQHVSLSEAQFLGNGRSVHVQCSRWMVRRR